MSNVQAAVGRGRSLSVIDEMLAVTGFRMGDLVVVLDRLGRLTGRGLVVGYGREGMDVRETLLLVEMAGTDVKVGVDPGFVCLAETWYAENKRQPN